MKRLHLAQLLLALAVFASLCQWSQADETKARDLILHRYPILRNPGMPPIVPVDPRAVRESFPDHRFFVVGFRQYPVAQAPPSPLRTRNLFAVGRSGQVRHLTDTGSLESFIRKRLRPVQTGETAKNAVVAWLRLSEEFTQDGFFRFAIPQESLMVRTTDQGRRASGKVIVTQGGKGEIEVLLVFDAAGRLVRIKEKNTVKPGVRPVCQATKLLDPDPIVRRIAENDILVMGRDCKAYLDEERAKASPELKRAIDRIWKRIVDEGW